MLYKWQITPAFLMLIPAPLLGQEFLSPWYTAYLLMALILISFLKLHKLFIIPNMAILALHIADKGMLFSPELTVPILANTIISLFLINKYKERFDLYPYFLWIGSFALFSSGFYYLSYIIITTSYILVQLGHNSSLGIKGILKTIVQNRYQFLITLVATILLFIFFPRFYHFLPSVSKSRSGEVGYSKSISNSTTAELNLSSKTAFFAEIKKEISPEKLYWRGRVHSYTDGYNWSHREPKTLRAQFTYDQNTIKQKIKYEQDMGGDLVLLDRGKQVIATNLNVHRYRPTHEFRTTFANKKSYITAISSQTPPKVVLSKKYLASYLQVPLSKDKLFEDFIASIDAKTAKAIINQFKYKIIKHQFTYSLKPGPLPTLSDFLKKKMGYCTHFASLLGLTLRAKGIPARLISGFQGGNYNKVSKHYEVKSNDAHAWVEYYDHAQWHRIDPTEFISPNRILLGGEGFLNPNLINSRDRDSFALNVLDKLTQSIQAINYKVSLFVDNFDRSSQNNLARFFHLKNKTFTLTGLGLLLFLFGLYFFIIRRRNHKGHLHPADIYLLKLNRKLRKDHISFKPTSPIALMLKASEKHPKKSELEKIINIYQAYKYGMQDKSHELKKMISQF